MSTMSPLPRTADDLLMSVLSPKELFSFAQTSLDHWDRVNAYMRRAFNIENLLSKYFTPSQVHDFRFLQSRTGLIISGSTALQFFERIEYPNSDLDIYVEHCYRKEVAEWLCQIGYVFESRHNMTLEEELDHRIFLDDEEQINNDYGGSSMGPETVYNFYKLNPGRKIQLITASESTLEVILDFHSTCVMNIITHEKAYALYPKATFVDRHTLQHWISGSEHGEARMAEAREKYADRGWTIIKCLSAEELLDKTPELMAKNRYLGDSFCWTIDLLPKLVFPKALEENNSWGSLWEGVDSETFIDGLSNDLDSRLAL